MRAYYLRVRLIRREIVALALALLVVSVVTDCGYHLRGNIKIDEKYLPVKVVDAGVNAEIKPRIIRQLSEANIPVVEDGNARLEIIIQGVEFDKRLVSTASLANIDTFEIGMKLRYKFSSGGKDLLPWQDLRINRILQFSKSAVVSSATEETTLRDDLLSDAIYQIVTRLRYLDQLEPLLEQKPPTAASKDDKDKSETATGTESNGDKLNVTSPESSTDASKVTNPQPTSDNVNPANPKTTSDETDDNEP